MIIFPHLRPFQKDLAFAWAQLLLQCGLGNKCGTSRGRGYRDLDQKGHRTSHGGTECIDSKVWARGRDREACRTGGWGPVWKRRREGERITSAVKRGTEKERLKGTVVAYLHIS